MSVTFDFTEMGGLKDTDVHNGYHLTSVPAPDWEQDSEGDAARWYQLKGKGDNAVLEKICISSEDYE